MSKIGMGIGGLLSQLGETAFDSLAEPRRMAVRGLGALTGADTPTGSSIELLRALFPGMSTPINDAWSKTAYDTQEGPEGPTQIPMGTVGGNSGETRYADSPLLKALGFVGDIALDPLTYTGMLSGGRLGEMATGAARAANLSKEGQATRLARAIEVAHMNPVAGVGKGVGEGRLLPGPQARGFDAREFPDIASALSPTPRAPIPAARIERVLPSPVAGADKYSNLIQEATDLGVIPFRASEPFAGTADIQSKMAEVARRVAQAKEGGGGGLSSAEVMMDALMGPEAAAQPRTMLNLGGYAGSPQTMNIPASQIAQNPSNALLEMLANVGQPLGGDMVLPPELMKLLTQRGGKTIAKSRNALAEALLPKELL